jgi:hypothetical protein
MTIYNLVRKCERCGRVINETGAVYVCRMGAGCAIKGYYEKKR